MNSGAVEDRVAVVTGAAGDIGRATAAAFLDAGWNVVGVDIRDGELPGGRGPIIAADLAEDRPCQNVFEIVANEYRRLDALVNNAAIQVCKPILETLPEEWDRVMAANLRAVYHSVRHGFSLLKASAGAIVNVASVHAIATSANIAAYAASKGGLVALTRALAVELSTHGIRANAVLPGAVEGQMLLAGLSRGHVKAQNPDDQILELGRKHVMGRVGQPEEIAQAVLFLSDRARSSFVTGASLVVDGGALSRLSTE